MRHTISVIGNNQIKSQRIQCKKLASFQEETIVKIQQSQRSVYAIYTPVQSNNFTSSQKSEISMRYLQLNKLDESLASMSKIPTPKKIKQIQIQLSSIDYELVNNNFNLLQRTFLDQVNIVWPQAKIPLYYDSQNFITLYPKVDGLYLVDPYAAISFSMLEDKGETEHQNEDNEQQQIQLQEKNLILQRIDDEKLATFGYDNIIYVGHQEFEFLNKFKKNQQNRINLCLVQTSIPFLQAPTFEEYLQYRNLQSSNNIPESRNILVQIKQCSEQFFKQWEGISPKSVRKINVQAQEHEIFFKCTSHCKISLGLSQKLIASEELMSQFQITQSISLEMFLKELKEQKYEISIQYLPSQKKVITEEDQKKLKLMFCEGFFDTIRNDKQFVFLQNYYPFIIGSNIYGLQILKKKVNSQQFQKIQNFMLIKNCVVNFMSEDCQKNQDNQIKNQINAKTLLNSITVQKNSSLNLNKWLPIIKNLIQMKNSNCKREQQFQSIFQMAFQKQLNEGVQFLKSQVLKQNSCQKILFSTYSSNGKTYLHTFLNNYQYRDIRNSNMHSFRSWYLDCRTLSRPSNRFEDLKDFIQTFITICPYKLIFFDNIETLLPNIQQGDQMRQKQKIISHVFATYLDSLLKNNQKIGIFTSKSQTNVDLIFKFDQLIKLKNPSRQIRQQIIKSLQLSQSQQFKQQLIDHTQSFSLGSFSNHVINRQIPSKKTSKRKNDFSKIVGLNLAKNIIKSVIQKPNRYGFIYDRVKIKVPRGILLYGATGNGKSALGTAVQDQFTMKFFSVKGSDILSKYIGGSEAAVRQIFQKALSVSPAIIFFDQFQSIVPRRNSSGTGVTDRVVNQFLCYLDGVSSTTGVFIIAASSRPDLIDPALLRPGRIDSHIYLQYPNQQQRSELLQMFDNSVRINVPQDQIIKLTQNYSYSDLIGLLKQLRIKQSSLILKQKQNPKSEQFKDISKQLFYQTIASYRIGTQIQEQTKQKQLFQKFKSGKGPQIKKQKFIQM